MQRFRQGVMRQLMVLAALVLLLQGGAAAQGETGVIDEVDFWALMVQTSAALESVESGMLTLPQLRASWEEVRSVRLDDGTVVPVDMSWLISGLSAEENAGGQTVLRGRVDALLDYRAGQLEATGSRDSLSALDRVFQDRRFQYPDVTPTPAPAEDDFSLPNLPVPGTGLSQILLIVAGTAAVGGILFYLLRGLRIQGRSIAEPIADGDDPETAADARDLAQVSEQAEDYRSAVRYLYLSTLLMLDERGLIHYDRSLTNREHLQQIQDKPHLLDILRPVVNTFDRVWYGFAPLDEARYQEYRQYVERLRELTL
jgi:hypothetical protein